MDRNSTALASFRASTVALRKESVDRNLVTEKDIPELDTVALRKESVDRNAHRGLRLAYRRPSLSARRAWIEIFVVITFSGFSNGRSPQGERG